MKWDHHNPRGLRSLPSYAVSGCHHLIDPMRPTRGHIATSPHGGLYAMPSLCGSAEATHAWFRAFAVHSFLTCRPLRPRGVRRRYSSRDITTTAWPSPRTKRLGTPKIPAIRFTRGSISWLHWFASATACQVARLPVGSDRDTSPANGGFYFQASDGSVSLPVAGYDYDIDWTPMSAGLTPAGMAASFAALTQLAQAQRR